MHHRYFTTTWFYNCIGNFKSYKYTLWLLISSYLIMLIYHQQDNFLILNIWCRWYNIYIEDNPRKALLPLMEILLCNIHITIYCISCNHHNFAARLFIPLCKRDGSAYTNCCAAYSQQFLMCVLSRLRTFAARQMQAIWLRSQESGRNNLFLRWKRF